MATGWHEALPRCTKHSRSCTTSQETLGQNQGVGTWSNVTLTLESAQPNSSWLPRPPHAHAHLPLGRMILEHTCISNDTLPAFWARWPSTVASPEWILLKALSKIASIWRYSFLLVTFAPFTSFFLLKRIVQGQSSRQTKQYHHKYENEPLVAPDDYPCHLKIQASPLILL